MFNLIILFVSATLGFVSTVFIILKSRQYQHSVINKYLIVVTAASSIRLSIHGIFQAYPTFIVGQLVVFSEVFFFMLMPIFFLYFKNMVNEIKFNWGALYHFIAPFLLLIVFILSFFVAKRYEDQIINIFFYLCILLYLTYACLTFLQLYKYIWNRKSEIKTVQQQNDLIKRWSMFLAISFVGMVLIRLILVIIFKHPGITNNQYFWISALIWAAVFIKIILTPEILYGYNYLNKTIDEVSERIVLKSVWKLDGTVSTISTDKDLKLTEKIFPYLLVYIHKIDELSFHSVSFRNPELGLTDLSGSLNIPISHLNYIFKYHCRESFSDYKKIVRIHDATKLLEAGFLKDKKIEMLSSVVGFSSYTTFYLAFKSITGVTTQDYIKRL